MKKLIAMLLVLAFALPAAALLEDNEVAYLGGTAVGVKENTTGHFDTTQVRTLVFEYKGGKLEIPYSRITHYEYTRKLARHLGVVPTIAVVLVKHLQRRHFFVINYKDEEGIAQSAVFEVAKDAPQTLEAVLMARAPRANRPAFRDPCNTGGLITESCPTNTRPCAVNSVCAPQQSNTGAAGISPTTVPARAPQAAPAANNGSPDAQPFATLTIARGNNVAQPAASRSAGKMDDSPRLAVRKSRHDDDDAPDTSTAVDSNKADFN